MIWGRQKFEEIAEDFGDVGKAEDEGFGDPEREADGVFCYGGGGGGSGKAGW